MCACVLVFIFRLPRTYTYTARSDSKMSSEEPIILKDVLFGKIPGSSKRKVRRRNVFFWRLVFVDLNLACFSAFPTMWN